MHQVECAVDFLERRLVSDEIVDVDPAVHVPIHYSWHIGAAACAAESGALPDTAGDQLERPGGNFLAGAGDPDDHRDPPAAVTAFQRLAHQIHIADAFEAVVGAAIGERHQMRDQIAAHLLGIHEMRQAEFLGQRLAGRIQIDADYFIGAHQTRTLNDIEADAAQAEHDHVGARLYLGGIDHRANARGDAAADVAHLVKWRILTDFRHRNFGQYREIRERGTAHVVMHHVIADGKTAGAIRHESLALRGADGSA